MEKSNYLNQMSWTVFEERKKHTQLVILALGACEVYGPHLPLGADTFVAKALSERIAEKTGAIIGPVLEVGDSSMLDEFPGTITIKPDHFKAYLNDVIQSLLKWGFKDFLFINGHAGNIPMISQIAYSLRDKPEIRKAQIDFWRFIQSVDSGISESGALAHSHAGEVATSLLLAVRPDLVDQEKTLVTERKIKDNFPEIMKYGKLSQNSELGTIGNSTMGNAEKGRLLLAKAEERILQFLIETWQVPLIKTEA